MKACKQCREAKRRCVRSKANLVALCTAVSAVIFPAQTPIPNGLVDGRLLHVPLLHYNYPPNSRLGSWRPQTL
jgi:hypothetical protein